MTAKVQLQKKKKKKSGRNPQGAWRKNELIGDIPPVVQ
jgi:hypothetical protein